MHPEEAVGNIRAEYERHPSSLHVFTSVDLKRGVRITYYLQGSRLTTIAQPLYGGNGVVDSIDIEGNRRVSEIRKLVPVSGLRPMGLVLNEHLAEGCPHATHELLGKTPISGAALDKLHPPAFGAGPHWQIAGDGLGWISPAQRRLEARLGEQLAALTAGMYA